MSASGSNVLVTGGRGFIGRYLVSALARAGHEVTSLDTAPVPSVALVGAREVRMDTRDTAAVTDLALTADCQTIFDLASHTVVGLPKAAYQRNVDSTLSMCEVAQRANVPRYVYFSTQFVYRRPEMLPRGEVDFHPVDHYGASKMESELAIRAALEPSRFLILRPTYVWGPGLQRFRDGLLYRLAKRQLLISSDPHTVRYYGFVRTVAAQAIALLHTRFNDPARRVYYLSDDAISLGVFCDALTAALGQGGARPVPKQMIRALGACGALLERLHLPAPINRMQARELTTNFPIPIEPTLSATGESTALPVAAAETVAWAKSDADWLARIRN